MTTISDYHTLVTPLTGIAHEIDGVLASAEALAVYRQAFSTGGALLPAASAAARSDTGYPVIESVTETTFAVDATAHAVLMPATVNAGDGLIVILTTDGDATVTTPAGWKRLYTEANGTALRGAAYAKVGLGTEGGTTVDFVTSASENAAAQVYRITNWNGTLAGIQAGTVGEVTTGTTADPAAVSFYWGSAKTICLATCHTSTTQTISSAPSGYTNLTQTSSAAATTGAQCISARISVNASAEDPGVFTTSGTGASKVYNTIAIAPAYAGAYYEQLEITRTATTLWVGAYTSQPIATADIAITRAVIVLHGSGLEAWTYHNVVQHNLADYLGSAIVVTPFFAESDSDPETGQIFWGTSWPSLGRSDASLAWRISSGEVLDELITNLYATFTNLEGVVIAGHSAGAQLANRYSAASTDTRNRYLISAASSYVYPGPERTDGSGGWAVPSSPATYDDWKYGLQNLSGTAYADAIGATALKTNLRVAKCTYMVGALDNDPADTSIDLTADAAVQGDHRAERQQLYLDYLERVFYYGSLLPAFGNLPIYNAGAIVHVTPDPPPVDPEPTPDFATEFTGVTLAGASNITVNYCSYFITGTDTETGFSPPYAAPLTAYNGAIGGGPGYGVYQYSTTPNNPSANSAGAAAIATVSIVDTTVRGEATKALRMKFLAPGYSVDQTKQMWFQIYRNTTTGADLPNYTVRYELKIPTLTSMLNSSYNRIAIFDIKSSGDFRYYINIVYANAAIASQYGCAVGTIFFEAVCDNYANGPLSYLEFWRIPNLTETVPQNENFTFEVSWTRAANYTDYSTGRFRMRIRRESDAVAVFRDVIDVSQSTLAVYNSSHGTSYLNRHMGFNTNKIQRMFHGIYPRILNVDCQFEIAKFRTFTSFDV